MKKLLAMVLTVSMTAAMVGCGQAAETTETAAESTAVETVESTAAEETATESTEESTAAEEAAAQKELQQAKETYNATAAPSFRIV